MFCSFLRCHHWGGDTGERTHGISVLFPTTAWNLQLAQIKKFSLKLNTHTSHGRPPQPVQPGAQYILESISVLELSLWGVEHITRQTRVHGLRILTLVSTFPALSEK